MNTIIDIEKFLQAVFPGWEKHAMFAHSKAGGGMAHTRDWRHLDVTRDCYWCIAAFPDDGKTTRSLARALDVRALVIDDVGTKVPAANVELALGKPTAEVITSEGNSQWTYRLSKPVAAKDWPAFFAGVEQLVGVPLEGRDAVHLFRLPMGFNTKPTRDGFEVQQETGCPEVELDTGASLLGSRLAESSSSLREKLRSTGAGHLGIEALRALMAMVPNTGDIDREAWVGIGHGLKALCADDVEGFGVFDAWSMPHASYDTENTRKAWRSFGVSGGLASRGGRLRAMAQRIDPAGFRQWDARQVFDDGVKPAGEPSPRGCTRFELGAKKEILRSRVNAERGILGLGTKCTYDAFHHRMYIEREGASEPVTDHAVMRLRVELTEIYGKDFGTAVTWDAVIAQALGNEFNPVVEMLAAAEATWDGARRLDRLGPGYFNTEDTEPARACFRKVMIAAVRRARRPGCKFDQVLVCESPEGWNKSSAWAVLAGKGNFSDESILGKASREVQEQLGDTWIHENADLSGLNKSEVEHVKAFASRTNDRARPAYGRVLINQPRQSIEVGTTNAESYLLSSTGNRRFWPFKLRARIDLDRLRRDRLQLWGEAAAAESAGETLVLAEALWPAMGAAQEERRVIDTWEIELENLPPNLVEERNRWEYITGLAVQEYLSGYRRQAFNSGSGRKIAEIMRCLGWERTQFRVDGVMTRGYKRQGSTICNQPGTPPGTENLF